MPINSAWYAVTHNAAVNHRNTLTLYLHQVLDIARGLAFLHQYNIVHGNLTGVGF